MKSPECSVCHTSQTFIKERIGNSILFFCCMCRREYLDMPKVHQIRMNPVKSYKKPIEGKAEKVEAKIGRSSSRDSGYGIIPSLPAPLELFAMTEMCSSAANGGSGDF